MQRLTKHFPQAATWRRKAKRLLYTPQIEFFKHFRNGLIYFGVGGICIYLANSSLPPSLKQEFVALLGLCLCGFGFIYAISAYLLIICSRLLIFLKQK